MIWIRISYPRSLGFEESVTRVDSSVPLMNHDPDDPKVTHPIFYHRNTQLLRSVEYANGSKNVKICRRRLRSSDYAELDHFTLMFCRGR